MERREYTQEDAEKEFKEYKAEQKSVADRAAWLKPIHEDQVIIHRLEISKFQTPLALDPRGKDMRKHEAWYGVILAISPVDSGDDIKEHKKKLLKAGDVVLFNADTPYSLNLKNFEHDIYVVHINNVLDIDRFFDLDKSFREQLEKKIGLPIY